MMNKADYEQAVHVALTKEIELLLSVLVENLVEKMPEPEAERRFEEGLKQIRRAETIALASYQEPRYDTERSSL